MNQEQKKIAANATWWNQLYDPKDGRPIREIPFIPECKECGQWNGHRLDCSEVTMEHMAKMVTHAQKHQELAAKRVKRLGNQLQVAVGRVAVLRHENNKLRKRNERLMSRSYQSIFRYLEDDPELAEWALAMIRGKVKSEAAND